MRYFATTKPRGMPTATMIHPYTLENVSEEIAPTAAKRVPAVVVVPRSIVF